MIPKSHPRYISLKTRDKIVDGVKKGITSTKGLIAHGRGEAFDYLLKEKTNDFAKKAIKAAAALLLTAKHPVISTNGNFAVLCPKEIITLSKTIPAKIEVNTFYGPKKRNKNIKDFLIKHNAKEVLMPEKPLIKYIASNRRFCNPNGIYKADVVFVPLEDGDRCEALIKMGKKVITIDLNPLSRTAQKANITIVDNVIRAMSLIIKEVNNLKKYNKNYLIKIIRSYNNKRILSESLRFIHKNLVR